LNLVPNKFLVPNVISVNHSPFSFICSKRRIQISKFSKISEFFLFSNSNLRNTSQDGDRQRVRRQDQPDHRQVPHHRWLPRPIGEEDQRQEDLHGLR